MDQKKDFYFNLKKDTETSLGYFFRINVASKMTLKNVLIDGENSNTKHAIVSTDINESGLCNIFVENVTFINFKNTNGGSIFKTFNGTKADTLSFTNTQFEESYRGLNLSYDKGVLWSYNSKIITLDNSA